MARVYRTKPLRLSDLKTILFMSRNISWVVFEHDALKRQTYRHGRFHPGQ